MGQVLTHNTPQLLKYQPKPDTRLKTTSYYRKSFYFNPEILILRYSYHDVEI